jgi:phenylalanyl-tRNA synthetase beta chain
LVIAQDLAEEVGRIYGYDKLVNAEPVRIQKNIQNDREFTLAEKIRHLLVQIGFDEIIGYTLCGNGDYVLEKPLSNDKNKLRTELDTSTREYLESNSRYLDLLGIQQAKVFEIARTFKKDNEATMLSIGVINQKGSKAEKAGKVLLDAVEHLSKHGIIIDTGTLSHVSESARKGAESKVVFDRKMEVLVLPEMDLGKMSIDQDKTMIDEKIEKVEERIEEGKEGDLSGKKAHKMFSKISAYPFATRDIAILVPGPRGQENTVGEFLINEAIAAVGAKNFVRTTMFDVFTKEFDGIQKTSYAFRIVFQSQTETLKDETIDGAMKKIAEAVVQKGWVVR